MFQFPDFHGWGKGKISDISSEWVLVISLVGKHQVAFTEQVKARLLGNHSFRVASFRIIGLKILRFKFNNI